MNTPACSDLAEAFGALTRAHREESNGLCRPFVIQSICAAVEAVTRARTASQMTEPAPALVPQTFWDVYVFAEAIRDPRQPDPSRGSDS